MFRKREPVDEMLNLLIDGGERRTLRGDLVEIGCGKHAELRSFGRANCPFRPTIARVRTENLANRRKRFLGNLQQTGYHVDAQGHN